MNVGYLRLIHACCNVISTYYEVLGGLALVSRVRGWNTKLRNPELDSRKGGEINVSEH